LTAIQDEGELQRLLRTVDPLNHQQMTFSDCVATLSADLVAVLGRGLASATAPPQPSGA